jgi:hypothetical protein
MSARTAIRRPATRPAETADPAVASDGMTIDTPRGPVDLVAIQRARAGRPVQLSEAETAYLYAHLRERDPLTEALDHRAP